MNLKETGKNQFEIYIPGKRDWDTVESIKMFLKKIQKQFAFFKTGSYFITVTKNEMGTLFEMECLERYMYRKTVDFQIEIYHLPFYIRSREYEIYREDCYFLNGYFYGLSSSLFSYLNACERVERVQRYEFYLAKRKGVCIKKRRELSSL